MRPTLSGLTVALCMIGAVTSVHADDVDDDWTTLVARVQWDHQGGFLDLLATAFQDCEQDRSDEVELWGPAQIVECKRKQRTLLAHLPDNLIVLSMDVRVVAHDAETRSLTIEIDGWEADQVQRTPNTWNNQFHLLTQTPRAWWQNLDDDGPNDYRPLHPIAAARITVQVTTEQWDALKVEEDEDATRDVQLTADVVFRLKSKVSFSGAPFQTKVGTRHYAHHPVIRGLLAKVVAWRVSTSGGVGREDAIIKTYVAPSSRRGR